MKYVKSVGFIVTCIICFLWIKRGMELGDKEYQFVKAQEINERVVDIEKPHGTKIALLVFANGTKFYPYTNALNYKVEIGDSLYKKPGEWYYVIYKGGRIRDSVVYQWQDSASTRFFPWVLPILK